jgi:hypothetical protein
VLPRQPLRDDARGYAARLDGDGVGVTYVEYGATMHAFLNFCVVLSAGDHAVELIAATLADTFAGPPGLRSRRSASRRSPPREAPAISRRRSPQPAAA